MPLKPVCTMKKQARPIHGLIPLCTLGVVIFVFVIEMKGSLHIPLIIGVLAAGLTAWYLGWKWDEILQAMLGGINQSLEAMLILLLIGMLTSAWIASGTVPTIICYGMKLIRPSFFLPAVFILCRRMVWLSFCRFAVGMLFCTLVNLLTQGRQRNRKDPVDDGNRFRWHRPPRQ